MEKKCKKSKMNEDEDLGSTLKELIKPENLAGEFNDTEEMFQVLLEDKQEEKTSDYVKELLKPENLIGPFESTEEMIRSMLED